MMKRFQFILLFLILGSGNFSSQKNVDSLKKRANSVMYEQPDEAISIALELLKGEKRVDEMAHLYMLISTAYIAKKNNDSSLFYNLKVENLISKTSSPLTKIKILNSVAVQYQQMELYDKALKILDEAQEMTDKFPRDEKIYLYNSGFINNTRGIIYRNQSNPDLALEKFKIAAKNFYKLELDEKSAANLSITSYNMGSCFLDLSQLQKAFTYYKEAYKYAKIYQDHILTAYALKGQGEIFFLTHQFEQSLSVLHQSEKLAEPIGDLVLNQEIYTLLANNNLALNNIGQFQLYNTKSLEILKTLEQDDLKSLNRYLSSQNLEQQEINSKVKKQFQIYDWTALLVGISLLVLFLKKIMDLKKKNLRQRKIIDILTKSKHAF